MKILIATILLFASIATWADGQIAIRNYANPEHADWSKLLETQDELYTNDYNLCRDNNILMHTGDQFCNFKGNCSSTVICTHEWNSVAIYYIKSHEYRCVNYGDYHGCGQYNNYQVNKAAWEELDTEYETCLGSNAYVDIGDLPADLVELLCTDKRKKARDNLEDSWDRS